MEKFKDILRKIGSILFITAVIVLIVAAIGIGFGFLTQRQFVLRYAFYPNFVVSAIIIATGIIGAPTGQGLMGFIRQKAAQFSAVVTDETYTDYMEERKNKRLQGREILWVGIAAALMTGGVEILVWLLL